MSDSKNSATLTILTSVAGAVIIAFGHFVFPNGWADIFKYAKTFFISLVNWLGFGAAVPRWLILAYSIALVIVFIWIALKLRYSFLARKREFTVEIATLDGIAWRWQHNQNGVYAIAPFCPVCDLQLLPEKRSPFDAIPFIGFRCDEGHWASHTFECSYDDLLDRVRRKLQRLLRNKTPGLPFDKS